MESSAPTALITGLVGFFLGTLVGYLGHDVMKKTFNMDENSSKNFLIVVITSIWAISMIVDIISPTYDVPVAVHGILGAIVGFFFWRPKQ